MSRQDDGIRLADKAFEFTLDPYPIDLSQSIGLTQNDSDAEVAHDPTIVAQYALTHWNYYLATCAEHHLRAFLKQAYWLIDHQLCIGYDAGGWPISLPHSDIQGEGPCLSALTQGYGVSVLVRAYQLTREEVFLGAARRAVHTFERDILDGGVCAPIGDEGIFFEEVAVYPAAHTLIGFIFALFGLYDYSAVTGNTQIEELIHRSHATMHHLLDGFDIGFWTRFDLLHRRLATPSQLALQVKLLEALARYASCAHCSTMASRWKAYQRQLKTRLRYQVTRCCRAWGRSLWNRIQRRLFPRPQASPPLRACVAVDGFPIAGGMLTVLDGIARVTAATWQIEYLTQHVGPHAEKYTIHQFGAQMTTPRYFPFVWLYFFAGLWELVSLLHHGGGYHVILPQSGTITGAFAALAARLAGVRVVCFDHGELSWLGGRNRCAYRAEVMDGLARKQWPWAFRFLIRRLLVLYWPSRYLLARVAVALVDHFLIPGVARDEIDEVCEQLGIPSSRVTRFASMIDIRRHIVLDAASKSHERAQSGIAADAIVVAMICRLAPEKGLDIALESLGQALSELPPELRARVRVIIAGDGPLRKHLEEGISTQRLSQTCRLWGGIPAEEVASLLAISDVFLYTSTRGACIPMAVLEAMASGCAVIASTKPLSNQHLLAEGRGIAVPPGDAAQTSMALVRLLSDLELCRRMGNLARDYVATHHSPAIFKRTLMRATYWSALDQFLDIGKELETAASESEGRR